MQLFGHQVRFNENLPAWGANSKSIAFGDFTRFQIRDAWLQTRSYNDSAYDKKSQVGMLMRMAQRRPADRRYWRQRLLVQILKRKA